MEPLLVSGGLVTAVLAIRLAYMANQYRLSKLQDGEDYVLTIKEKDGGLRIFQLSKNGDTVEPDSENRNY